MRRISYCLTIAGLAALWLTACGGGGGSSGSSSGGGNSAPTANAGSSQTVSAGAIVTLSGSGADSDGSVTAFAWTQTGGTAVTLSATNVASPTFTAPNVTSTTVLTFSLIVTDNRGASSSASIVSITVNAVLNLIPSANAGPAQFVSPGATVTLNGSGSDSDGTIAAYAWTQTAGPAVSLSATNSAAPTFTAPTVTTTTVFTFSLVVTDNGGASSAPSNVNVTVNPAGNAAPTANPGPAQSVPSGQMVTLSGGASTDSDGTIVTFEWTQTEGPTVTLATAGPGIRTFTAPTVSTSTVLTFSLVVTDDDGASSAPATVNVTVNPVGTPNVTISGRIRHARPMFSASFPYGLVYSTPVFEASRGVIVRALYSGTSNVIATTSADANGDYTIQVPGSTSIQIRAVAWLVRDTGQPLPRYDIRVQDGGSIGGTDPYSYTDTVFNSASGTTRNVDIPLNINASGQATGARASGPFAILDTIYAGMQLILGGNPTANFPALIVDWGSQTDGTFFQSASPQRIALLSDLDSDTDEFDAHVVAHEFGHYIEHNFSRSDSIGGPHSVGDQLDIRVAFGEGFGYAFAAMVLDDPNARDSFTDNGTAMSGGFNIEDNPPAPNDPDGCWCSESSVWAILYDIFDANADAGDNVALGFPPIWDVLTGEQADTPAFTSIFTFISALKAAQPASVAGIDALLAAQNIATNTTPFATTESNLPVTNPPIPSNAVFPLYTTINDTGTATLQTTNDAGLTNKLGNHRYIRFENSTTRNVTITVATSNSDTNADPDFLVWRAGTFIRAGTQPPPGPEVQTITNLAAGTYVIDVYDCGNGCSPAEGASGDYELTVTIN